MATKQLLTADDIRRALVRIAHEVLEHNRGAAGLVFMGLQTRGVPIAHRLAALVRDFEGDRAHYLAYLSGLGYDVSGGYEAMFRPAPGTDESVRLAASPIKPEHSDTVWAVEGALDYIRIRNQVAPQTEGGVTRHFPDGQTMSIYDASVRYQQDGVPLLVIAGAEYGTGSSRDWAAKGTYLLGVRAVIASSYERIHRSNLVGMGVLPLEFTNGQTWQSLGLTGDEAYDIEGIDDTLRPRSTLTVRATSPSGAVKSFEVAVRIDTPVELDYYRNGGIMPTVLRRLAEA